MELKKINLFIILIINIIICINATSLSILKDLCTYEKDGQFYDLRSLSLKSGILTVENGDEKYLINICSTTNTFLSSNKTIKICSKRAAVCLVKNNEPDVGYEIATSISGKPEIDENNNLMLNYMGSDSNKHYDNCEELDVSFKFICLKTKPLENKPVFVGKDKCKFNFEWKTTEACVDSHSVLEPHYKNESLIFSINNKTINLEDIFDSLIVHAEYNTSLNHVEKYDFAISKDLKDFIDHQILNRNSYAFNLTACYDSFVCQLKDDRNFKRSIANRNGSLLKYAADSFHLVLPSDSQCGRSNQTTAAVFNLYCDGSAKNITFKAENNKCEYIFDLYNPKVCEYEELINQKNVISSNQQSTDNLKVNQSKNDKQQIKEATVKPEVIVQPVQNTEKPTKVTTKNTTTTAVPIINPNSATKDSTDKIISSNHINAQQVAPQDSSHSNTTVFGCIILAIVSVVGIVLAVFSLINDDRRAWLQNRVRRVIQPQNPTSFHYSQLSTNLLMNNNQPPHENFNSPYSPTVISKSLPRTDQTKYNALINETNQSNQFNLRNNSTNIKSSIRDHFPGDLGVSNNFNSISFRTTRSLSSKDEAELNLLT